MTIVLSRDIIEHEAQQVERVNTAGPPAGRFRPQPLAAGSGGHWTIVFEEAGYTMSRRLARRPRGR